MLKTQRNAQVHLVATLIVCGLGLYFDLTKNEWLWIIVSITIVWLTEALNTSIELLGDVISKDYHFLIGKSKDVAAGAVLISAMFSTIIGFLIFMPHIIYLIKRIL